MPSKRKHAEELKAISREHILQALGDLNAGVKHAFADSTGFDLVHRGKHYPPKAVFGVAGRYALGEELLPEHFSGGEDSLCFQILRREGFEVVPKKRAFLLTWNPEHFSEASFRQELQDFESGETTSLRWSVGHRKDLPVGSSLFLMRLGAEPKGIVGRAISIRAVEEYPHWDKAKAEQGLQALYVAYQPLYIQEEPYLPLALLKEEWPDFDWTPQSSGVEIHDTALISFLNADYQEKTGIQLPNEVSPEEGQIESASSQTMVNANSSDWTDAELTTAVDAYLFMLLQESKGIPYSKAEINRQLREGLLSRRTHASIEYRMQNISATLEEFCMPRVHGYLPAKNIGNKVKDRIASILANKGVINYTDYAPSSDEDVLSQRVTKLCSRLLVGIPRGSSNPQRISSISSGFIRDPLVRAWVLQNANGKCEGCGNYSPFQTDDGSAFLEVHHVKMLANGGPDKITNAVALCPNCHRRCHFSIDRLNFTSNIYKFITRLIP